MPKILLFPEKIFFLKCNHILKSHVLWRISIGICRLYKPIGLLSAFESQESRPESQGHERQHSSTHDGYPRKYGYYRFFITNSIVIFVFVGNAEIGLRHGWKTWHHEQPKTDTNDFGCKVGQEKCMILWIIFNLLFENKAL